MKVLTRGQQKYRVIASLKPQQLFSCLVESQPHCTLRDLLHEPFLASLPSSFVTFSYRWLSQNHPLSKTVLYFITSDKKERNYITEHSLGISVELFLVRWEFIISIIRSFGWCINIWQYLFIKSVVLLRKHVIFGYRKLQHCPFFSAFPFEAVLRQTKNILMSQSCIHNSK